ncbi:serine/threonine-protein kinase pim-2-like [Genypterus blacodes]|uniref:serine/threonine-protein kinase pim-2-like n=1 Tax=Genypterus blacodes TaxID=154954 RepID=UPI003F76A205
MESRETWESSTRVRTQVVKSEATESNNSNTEADVATLKRRQTIKRKVIRDNSGEFLSLTQDDSQTSSKLEGRSSKRKTEDDRGGTRKRRGKERKGKSLTPSKLEVMKSILNCNICRNSRVYFEAAYSEEESLGQGGFGEVFAGYRKEDNLPVAIKHVDQTSVVRTPLRLNGDLHFISLEAVMMYSAWAGRESTGNNPVVALLDCFDLDDELILVMERPVPCMDLLDYIKSSGGLQEHIAKVKLKQLVDAAVHMKSKGVFHRDLKLQNILIQTTSSVPCVKVIDFGCGIRFTQHENNVTAGTFAYCPPEMHLYSCYKAEPTTVWQLGLLLYAMVHGSNPFQRKDNVCKYLDSFGFHSFSSDCRRFLESCLAKNPDDRPTLEDLEAFLDIAGKDGTCE